MPTATLENLRLRASVNRYIRRFFETRQLLEVEPPVLVSAPVSDPWIESVTARCSEQTFYLHTSPEYAMKRLLVAGSGAIYSLGKVFRSGEAGRRHNPEFTLLEWYRLGYDDRRLMGEVAELLAGLLPDLEVQTLTYRNWFEQSLGIDPHRATAQELAALAHQCFDTAIESDDRDLWLDLLVSHHLEPAMAPGLTFICDYPASQAALARIVKDDTGQLVARRFEAFLDGMELANGYWELSDAGEQRRRFEADQRKRRAAERPVHPLDEKFLAALEQGLPDCAGVALGVDRLLMCLADAERIGQVLAFDIHQV